MVAMYKIKEKRMELNDILNYISEHSKEKKKESIIDLFDDNNIKTGREFKIEKEYGIVDKFIFKLKNGELYFSHIYENPNQSIDLDDADDIDNM